MQALRLSQELEKGRGCSPEILFLLSHSCFHLTFFSFSSYHPTSCSDPAVHYSMLSCVMLIWGAAMPPFLGPKEQDVLPCREMQGTTGILRKSMDTYTAEETPGEQALDKSWRQITQTKRILQTFSRMNGFILTLPATASQFLLVLSGLEPPSHQILNKTSCKLFQQKNTPNPNYLPISLCSYLSLSPTNTAPHQLPGWAGEIPSPMAQSFHLCTQFCSLFSSAFHVFSPFFSTLFREQGA